MTHWTVLFLSFTIAYSLFTLRLWWAWRQIPVSNLIPEPGLLPFLSVVIVVRNEEKNIASLLQDLSKQHYPADQFEVLVVDDHSTDATIPVIRQFAVHTQFPPTLLFLADHLPVGSSEGNYKKKAIEWAVSQAKGEWIVLTDGDCRVGPDWLRSIAQACSSQEVALIAGPVTFEQEKTAFERMQTVEFASLIGSGAATLQMGFPTMCNAANLAFSRAAFYAVGGYQGTAPTATGDDLFLMHKIHLRFPGSIRFLKNREAIVRTSAKATWGDFFQQRKRWASKWKLYQDRRVIVLALFVFLSNVILLSTFLLVFFGKIPVCWFLMGLLLRFGAEFFFLADVLTFLGQSRKTGWIVPVQAVYFLYVVFFGVIAQKRGYVWKGRKLN